LSRALGQKLLDFDLADDVARAVGRLLQVELLLTPDGVAAVVIIKKPLDKHLKFY